MKIWSLTLMNLFRRHGRYAGIMNYEYSLCEIPAQDDKLMINLSDRVGFF